jgi:hypothetical protein
MSLNPVRVDWPRLLTGTETYTFEVEARALTNTKSVFWPVLRFHNMGTSSLNLKITYTLDMGSGDDPLLSGTFTQDVVDEAVASGAFRDYAFGGTNLTTDSIFTITHTVEIVNSSGTNQLCHTLLFGGAEVEAQLPASQPIIRNA